MTKSEQKIIASNIFRRLTSATNILLHLHKYPDPDSIGANVALASYLINQLHKKVTLLAGDTQILAKYSIIPGIEYITNDSLKSINFDDFDLFILMDSSGIDRISADFTHDQLHRLATINIDHHPDNTIDADINYIDTTASSTSELIYRLFSEWKYKPNITEALNLYLGIVGDTGGFRFPGTTSDTLLIASKLAKIAPSFNEYNSKLSTNELEALDFVSLAISHRKTYLNDNVLVSALPRQVLLEHNINENQTKRSMVADLFNSVKHWKIIVILTEFDPNKTVAIFRTIDRDIFDVSPLAQVLGGGGHAAASAATVNLPLNEATPVIIEQIQKLYDFS